MPLPSLDKGDVPVYGICLYMFCLLYTSDAADD